MEYSNFTTFDAFANAEGTTTVDATKDPSAANAALSGIFDAGPAPEPQDVPKTSCALPVGIVVDGERLKVARVRELTGEDEEELAKVGTDPFRYFDAVVRRGTEEIDHHWATAKMLRSAAIADRDTLVLAIRIATYGPEYTWEQWQCPECGEYSDLTFRLDDLEVTSPPDGGDGSYEVVLRGGEVAQLRLPTGEDQAALFSDESATIAQQNSMLIGRCVTEIVKTDGRTVKGHPDLGRQLGMADRKLLIAGMAEHAYGPQLGAIPVVHEACGKEVKVALSFTALFR